ncbi:hypothetical protein L1278_003810 [Pontibacter sp. HSC-36F09]|nr:hypothetical protein [Pontibacter sp. HSC-36F09]
MYAPYNSAFETLSIEKIRKVLPLVNYAIIPVQQLTEKHKQQIQEYDMIDCGTYYVYENPIVKVYGIDYSNTTILDRVQNVYRIYRQPYGPYKLFSKRCSVTIHAHNIK